MAFNESTERRVFRIAGVILLALGSLLFLSLPFALAGWLQALAGWLGDNPYTYYLAATGGSALLGWGACLVWSAQAAADVRRAVAMGSGVGFLGLSLMRLYASMAVGVEAYDVLRFAMIGETVLFLAASLVFFQVGCSLMDRLADTWRSLLSVKRWVLVWIFVFLAPVNLLSFMLYPLTNHPVALWTAVSFMFVLLTNLPLGLYERGISKATSIPHLIPWIPLVVYVGAWVSANADVPVQDSLMWWYALAVLSINGISVPFDLLDSYRWVRGDRKIAGAPA